MKTAQDLDIEYATVFIIPCTDYEYSRFFIERNINHKWTCFFGKNDPHTILFLSDGPTWEEDNLTQMEFETSMGAYIAAMSAKLPEEINEN